MQCVSSKSSNFTQPTVGSDCLYESANNSRHACKGDQLNSVLADSITFASVSIALSAVWSVITLNSHSGPFKRALDQPVDVIFGAISLMALVVVLIVRSRMDLMRHTRDATLLALTSFIGVLVLTTLAVVPGPLDLATDRVGIALGTSSLVAACRLVFGSLIDRIAKWGHLRRRVAIYGATLESAHCLAQLVGDRRKLFVGLFDERGDHGRISEFGISVRGDLDELVSVVARGDLDEVIIALPPGAGERAGLVADKFSAYPVHLRWSAAVGEQLVDPDVEFQVSTLGTVELVDAQNKPFEGWNLVAKQIQDRLGALLLLVVFSPIILIISVAIKLDSPGSVFFRQRRHGICGRIITVWKFRSMNVLEDGPTVVQARSMDPRVTRVGRLLRKSSLDELPQLINVLLGDMSLVGPRPHAIAHNDYYAQLIRTYNGRNRIKPGITGWAQVNGYRGETSTPDEMVKRIEHDHWYIRNWSIWLDAKILLLTPIFGLFHKNAY